MSGKLTKTQRLYLSVISDWSAVYEILDRTAHQFNSATSTGVRVALNRCINYGLAEWSASNDTYRITPAGRAALNPTSSGEGE